MIRRLISYPFIFIGALFTGIGLLINNDTDEELKQLEKMPRQTKLT
jgi:hypothetical protein